MIYEPAQVNKRNSTQTSSAEWVDCCPAGEKGLTNQRFMAQYGFVPAGNMSDRIEFEVPETVKAGCVRGRRLDLSYPLCSIVVTHIQQ